MEYIKYTDFEKNPLPKVRYTLIYVGGMACSGRIEIEIRDFIQVEEYAQYKDLIQMVFKERGKRKEGIMYLKSSMLFLSGWNLNIKVDTDFNSFKGNACLNLVGNEEEIKRILKEHNKFYFSDFGIITFSEDTDLLNGKVLFPESANRQHAVINRMLA